MDTVVEADVGALLLLLLLLDEVVEVVAVEDDVVLPAAAMVNTSVAESVSSAPSTHTAMEK